MQFRLVKKRGHDKKEYFFYARQMEDLYKSGLNHCFDIFKMPDAEEPPPIVRSETNEGDEKPKTTKTRKKSKKVVEN